MREAAQALLMQGRADEAFELFASALGAVLRKSQDLELLVLKLQRERVGKTSERVDAEQLRLMFEQLCGQGQASQDGATAAPDPEAEEREDSELRKKIEEAKKAQAKSGDDKPRGRKKRVQAVAVERQIHRHELPEAERACAECGETESRIGEDVTHRLEYVPGHFVDHEHHNEKYACAKCREGVTTAPKPDQVIERSSADASVLAHVVVFGVNYSCRSATTILAGPSQGVLTAAATTRAARTGGRSRSVPSLFRFWGAGAEGAARSADPGA